MWPQTELKAEVAVKTAAISLLEETVTSLESTLQENMGEWQAAFEYLDDSYKNDKVRLEEQLLALTTEKVLSILRAFEVGLDVKGYSFLQWLSDLSIAFLKTTWKTKHGRRVSSYHPLDMNYIGEADNIPKVNFNLVFATFRSSISPEEEEDG